MFRNWSLAAVLLSVALVTGCSQQKPAEQAVDAAEQAVSEVHELALKYAPKQYAELKAELDAARKSLTDGKYPEALAAAREMGFPYEEGLAHYEIGRHLPEGEAAADGLSRREHLERAAEIFARLEIPYELELCRAVQGRLKT